jgi:hypothetical protein
MFLVEAGSLSDHPYTRRLFVFEKTARRYAAAIAETLGATVPVSPIEDDPSTLLAGWTSQGAPRGGEFVYIHKLVPSFFSTGTERRGAR